jgi:muramoyltetrapeptide carboxypeptidase
MKSDLGSEDGPSKIIKPKQLQTGDTVALISPASPYSYIYNMSYYLKKINLDMKNLSLEVKYGQHMNEVYGYLAGKDEDRGINH